MSTIRRRVVVQGRVQGVFFRAALRDLAVARGVAGSARNLDDGSVEVVLEGTPEAEEELIDFCRRGPPDARVERIAVYEEEPQGVAGFSIG